MCLAISISPIRRPDINKKTQLVDHKVENFAECTPKTRSILIFHRIVIHNYCRNQETGLKLYFFLLGTVINFFINGQFASAEYLSKISLMIIVEKLFCSWDYHLSFKMFVSNKFWIFAISFDPGYVQVRPLETFLMRTILQIFIQDDFSFMS